LLATGFPYYRFDRMEEYMASLGQLMRQCRGLRRLGSAALDLAYVACGRFDAYFEHNLQPWDVAAGILLVREAGGVVRGIREGVNPLHGTEILASGQRLSEPVRRELNPEGA
ncbi:MAG: inositol monophosphatase, partial [Sphingobacteriia bacterium]|nr:inositol monophosphatase [Sphingobacteriia bacterium]